MDTNFWGYVHTIQMTAFCASKYAVTGLTDTLRLELAPKGIQVCAVHPGLVNSVAIAIRRDS
jgi:NAD(P)-dependent dehydrogenase (short-subunit alcohol dehydrogenase family)